MSESCALFIDHENIYFGLLNELGDVALIPNPEEMGKKFREAAARYGMVRLSVAIADWEQPMLRGHVKGYILNSYQIDYNITGRNNADLKISNEIRNVLENSSYKDVHTYILATGDGGYQPIIETLLQKGHRVVVWGVKNCTSNLLQALATEFEAVERILNIQEPEKEEQPYPYDYVPYRSGEGGIPGEGFTISTLEALIIRFDEYLVANGFTYATFHKLMEHFLQNQVCGETPQEQEFWFDQAKDQGVVTQEEVEEDGQVHYRLTLNAANSLVQKTLAVKAKLFKMLKDTLNNNFCPDFKRARDTMVAMIPGLNKSQSHTWLNWYINEGIVVTEKRPHLQKPGAFFTVLKLNSEHAYVKNSMTEWPIEERVRLLVTLVDDFLSEKKVPWIAASTLLKILKANYLREGFHGEDAWLEAKELLNESLKIGAISKSSERDPLTGFETSQIFLDPENPKVIEILDVKNTIILKLHESLRDRNLVARGTFSKEVEEVISVDKLKGEVQPWLDMLIDSRIILQKPVSNPFRKGTSTATLTLNYANPVVIQKIKIRDAQTDQEAEEEKVPEENQTEA